MKRIFFLSLRTVLPFVLATFSTSAAVLCDEISVMTSGGFASPLTELIPQFERSTHNKVVVITTSMGLGQNSIPNRVRSGEAADLVVLPDDDLMMLIHEDFVRIGMAVRSGAPKPDISSVEALKRTLLQARSIAYSAQVSGQYLSTELFPRLGVGEQIKDKSKRVEIGRVGSVVASWEAEIGFQQISELLPIPGIDYVGPLPAEVQRTTLFSAGIPASSTKVASARSLIGFLASRDSAATIKKAGLEPLR